MRLLTLQGKEDYRLKKNIDRGRQVYAFGAGTKKMYDYLDDNPECMSAPVDYTNSAKTIAQIDNFILSIMQLILTYMVRLMQRVQV